MMDVISNKVLLVLTAFLATLFSCNRVLADDYATGAVGIAHSARGGLGETKFLNIGHRDDLGLGFTYQYEAGGWADNGGHGRRSSVYGAYQVGVETDGPTFARVMAGPAIISSPDVYLGGPFQMTEDFYLGMSGGNGNTIGILYKHFSSAGLEKPNVGRDFFGVSASIPL